MGLLFLLSSFCCSIIKAVTTIVSISAQVGGFEPFVDERGDRVAILGSLRTSLGLGYTHMEFDGVASSGCDKDSWADASAPTPSWTGATESGQSGGDQGILGSLRVDEASALVDTMLGVGTRRVDCDVDSTSSAEAHAQGDPPRIGDTGAYNELKVSKSIKKGLVLLCSRPKISLNPLFH